MIVRNFILVVHNFILHGHHQVYPSNKVLQNPHEFKREIASLMS